MRLLLLIVLLAFVKTETEYFQPYNYYVFAVKRGWESTEKNWTIHGLWPECTPKTWPQFCQPKRYKEYNETLLLETYPAIITVWPPESLWKHEWIKHGTCTNMTMLKYFGKAITLYDQGDYTKCCSFSKSKACQLNYDLNFNFTSCDKK